MAGLVYNMLSPRDVYPDGIYLIERGGAVIDQRI
jgi:hypothetical protein